MRERLSGKVAVITGGASGIGLASARRMIAEGARVVIADIDRGRGEAAVGALLPGSATFVACNVADDESVRSFIGQAIAVMGRIDVVVNNAGTLVCAPVTEIAPDAWEKSFNVNVKGAYLMCRHAVPHMRASGGGSIINMSSLAGLRGMPGLSLYSATKAALIGFSATLALELAPDRIRVNAVCPGWIDTAFNQPVINAIGGPAAQARAISSAIPLARMGEADEVAAMVAYLASDEASFVTAQALSINGGAYN